MLKIILRKKLNKRLIKKKNKTKQHLNFYIKFLYYFPSLPYFAIYMFYIVKKKSQIMSLSKNKLF